MIIMFCRCIYDFWFYLLTAFYIRVSIVCFAVYEYVCILICIHCMCYIFVVFCLLKCFSLICPIIALKWSWRAGV